MDWSKILMLSTPEDTRADVLRCGEALSTVLLECTMAGMSTCTLTHLIEVNQSRDIVRNLIEQRSQPQVLIRVGIAPPIEDVPAPTPRNPLGDVFQIRENPRSRYRAHRRPARRSNNFGLCKSGLSPRATARRSPIASAL